MIKTTQSQDKLQNNLTKRRQDLWNRIINEKENLNIDQGSICVDSLIDILLALFDDCKNIEASVNENIATFLTKYQPSINKIRALRLNKYDFQVLKKLAKGHFGTVRLFVSVVRNKLDNRIYAMKTLNKMYVLRCKELSFFMEEKEVLSLSKYSPWIPKLYAAFQDSENLYLVMEFAGGGDLFSLLDRNYPPIINEEEAKFYIGEIVLALSDLHSMGFVHRDLKPQNILIDNQGHIKLADFGSCIQLNNQSSVTSNIPVGTSDYISPEVLRAQEGNTNYGVECDWWSVGVLIYELLQGDPPFSSENLMETHSQIMNHKNNLMFHGIYPISEEARDLIEKLICDREVRLGKNGVEEIKSHPFFRGINWNSLRNQTPPFIPTLITPDDTSNFNGYEDEEDTHEVKVVPRSNQKEFMGDHLPFVGFTYQQ
ncbi:Mrck beta in complex with Tpca-1, partial [Neoconidiobolus thromboides FSU 785]